MVEVGGGEGERGGGVHSKGLFLRWLDHGGPCDVAPVVARALHLAACCTRRHTRKPQAEELLEADDRRPRGRGDGLWLCRYFGCPVVLTVIGYPYMRTVGGVSSFVMLAGP